MDQLIELLKQIQDLAGVAIDALEGAGTEGGKPTGDKPEGAPDGGPPPEGKPEGGAPGGPPPEEGGKPPFEKR